MAVEYKGKGSFSNHGTDLNLLQPSDVAIGDLLICFMENAGATYNIPDGWFECPSSPISTGSLNTTTGIQLVMMYKIATSATGNAVAWTFSNSSNHNTGIMTSWRGVDTNNPFNTHANDFDASATTSKSFPSVTTTVANAMIINAIGLDRDTNSTATISAWANANLESITEGHDQTISTVSGGGFAYAYGIKASSGSTGNTTATSAVSLADVYITLALTPLTNDKFIIGAISQSSTVEALTTKQSSLVAEISQASTVVSVNTKQSNLIAEVSQPLTVVSAYTKSEGATDYDLVASISQGSTVSAQNTKAINLVGSISQGQTVVAENKKSIYVLAQVSQGSSVVSHVVKYEPSYDYNLTAEIEQSSTVEVSAKKQSSLVASVGQTSEVSASLSKQSSLVGQVAQDESVGSQASKHIQVIASVSQGSTIYSFFTKEELEKTISASVGQSSSVVASVSKQGDITALIEQISVVLARISRGSTTRLIHPIRLTSSFKGGVRHGMIMPEPLGKVLQLKGAIKSQTRFNQPIRKELKF